MTRPFAVPPDPAAWAVPAAASDPAIRSWWRGLLLALAGLFALRVVLMVSSQASLHVDEAQYWDWSRQLQWGYYSKPPVIAALIRASTSLFGDSELGIRLLAMLCWPLMAWVLAVLGNTLAQATQTSSDSALRPVQIGVAAALLWLCSPLAGLLGMVATTDTPLLLCWALALYALWRAVILRRRGAWWLLGLVCGVGLLDKYTMAALLPGAAVWVLRQGRPRDLLRLAGAVLLALVLLAPNLIWNAAADWPTLRHTADITVRATAPGNIWQLAPQRVIEFVLGQVIVLGPLVLLGALVWAVRRKGAKAASLPTATPMKTAVSGLLLWTSLPLLAVGLLQAARGHAEINWIAPVHLAAVLALAHAVPRLARLRGAALLLVLQLSLISAISSAPVWLQDTQPKLASAIDPWRRMRGWHDAFAELEPHLRAQPGGLVVIESRLALAQAAYHWRHADVRRAAWTPQAVPDHHYQLTCPWQPGLNAAVTGPLWVLSEGAPGADMAAALGGLELVAEVPVRRLGRVNSTLQLLRAPHPPAVATPLSAAALVATCL